MKCEVSNLGNAAVITLCGDIDLESSPKVRTTLLGSVECSENVIADLSAVTYIDSSGVASLVEAYQCARKTQKDFSLAAVSEPAMRVLQLARLDKVFSIYPTVTDGIKD